MPGIAGPPTVPPQPPQDMTEDWYGEQPPRRRHPPLTPASWGALAGVVGFGAGLGATLPSGVGLAIALGRGVVFGLMTGLIGWAVARARRDRGAPAS